jgi:hypothetical protein
MGDLVFVVVTVAFFALCGSYVRACDRIVRFGQDGERIADEPAERTGAAA